MSAAGEARRVSTGAEALVSALETHTDVVFGLPGVHNLPAWEALRASPIRLVSVRHEQTAAYAADGYARATGRPGVALVTTGPGAANTVTATGEAYASGSPLVVIATDVPSTLRRPGVNRGVLHETDDQPALFAPVTKARFEAVPGDDLEALVDHAIRVATRPPMGPVYVGIPTDLLGAAAQQSRLDAALPEEGATVDEAAVDQAASLLAAAERPLVWAGAGAVDAGKAVGALAERLGAPLVTTLSAAGVHPSELRPAHHPAVGALWDAADVVVAIGSDFDGTDTQNWAMPRPPALIAVNVDRDDAAKSWTPDVMIHLEAEPAAGALLHQVTARAPWFERPDVSIDDPDAATLLDAIPADAVVVCDMCIPGYWIGGFHRPASPRSVLYPIGWGTLGFGFPAAIGAALAGRTTIAVVGDGGFLFACGELATVAQERIPLTIVLFDDKGYGMLRHDGGDPFVLHTPDFVKLTEAFDVPAERVALEDLKTKLTQPPDGPRMLVVEAALAPPVNTSPKWPRRSRT